MVKLISAVVLMIGCVNQAEAQTTPAPRHKETIHEVAGPYSANNCNSETPTDFTAQGGCYFKDASHFWSWRTAPIVTDNAIKKAATLRR